MFDARLQPIVQRLLAPLGAALAEAGVTADAVSLAGFGFGLLGAVVIAFGAFKSALVLIAINRVADGLDGALARRRGPTDRGAFIDIAFDFSFYASVPLAFAFADPARDALAAAVLIFAFVGTGSSFLAFAAVAGARGLKAPEFPTKGIYYLGGLAEGAETIAVFVAMCLWPSQFPLIASGFAALCLLTMLARWRWGWKTLAPTGAAAATQEENHETLDLRA